MTLTSQMYAFVALFLPRWHICIHLILDGLTNPWPLSDDINDTVDQHYGIIPHLLAAHDLTDCETMALGVLGAGMHALSYLGDINRTLPEIICQATPFILTCYDHTKCTSLTEASWKMWTSKVRLRVDSSPKLASTPTNEEFRKNRSRGSHSSDSSSLEACTTTRSTEHETNKLDGHTTIAPTDFHQLLFQMTHS